MSDIDGLLQMSLASPADSARRFILADALAEVGEAEIETALRGESGEAIIRRVYHLADALKRPACLRLLWSVAVVEDGIMAVAPSKLSSEMIRRIQNARQRSIGNPIVMPSNPIVGTIPPRLEPVKKRAKPRIAELKWMTSDTPPVGPT